MFDSNDAGTEPTPQPREVTIVLRDRGDTYQPFLGDTPLAPASMRPMIDASKALQALDAPLNAILVFVDESGRRIGAHLLEHLAGMRMSSIRGAYKPVERKAFVPFERSPRPVAPIDRRERGARRERTREYAEAS
jgi:hypothetical protein